MDNQPNPKCHCGKELHYDNIDVQRLVENVIAARGSFLRVTIAGRTWLVQRHYIALHGLQAGDVPTLGFEEVTYSSEETGG